MVFSLLKGVDGIYIIWGGLEGSVEVGVGVILGMAKVGGGDLAIMMMAMVAGDEMIGE